MTADVFSNTSDPVSHQTLANAQRVVLTNNADTVNVTTAALQTGSADPTVPLPTVSHCVADAFASGDAVEQRHKVDELIATVGRMTR
jgi:hypothetical protein